MTVRPNLRAAAGPAFGTASAYRYAAGLAGGMVALIGLVALAGWILDFAPLHTWLPGRAAMKTNAALGLALAGAVQAALAFWGGNLAARRAAGVGAGMVMLLGVLTLSQYFTGAKLGIDEWLFAEPATHVVQFAPNQMPPAAAACFALIGGALLLAAGRRGIVAAQGLALAAMVIAFTSALGYLYGSDSFRGLALGAYMALPAALSFLALGAGLLWLEPDCGVMAAVTSETSAGALARRLLPMLVVVQVGLGWLQLAGEWRGIYAAEFGTALIIASSCAILGGLILANTHALFRGERERQRTAASLRESEARYRAAFEQAAVGMAHMTIDGRWLRVNQRLCEILGYSHEELLALHFQDLTHPDDLPADRIALGRFQAGEIDRHQMEKRYRRRDGAITWAHVCVSVVHGAQRGEPDYLQTVTEDITERKQAEEDLRRATELLRTVSESTTDLIYAKDRECRILLANPATLGVIGKPADKVLDRSEAEWHDNPEQAAAIMANDRRIMASGRGEVIEEEFTGPQGRHVYLSTKTPLRDSAGNVTGLVGLSRDITERIEAEEALRRAHDRLEERVQERTTALVAANREMEAFSYSISHDLRAPLRAIDGYTCVLVEDYNDRLDEEGRRVLGVVRSEAQRMGKLIDGLLSFSRLDRQAMELRETDMRALAEAAFAEARALEPGRQILGEVPPLPPAHGEPIMLRQVWANLLLNAVKFTRHRADPRIEIGASRANGDTVYFVRDNGVGFDMAHTEKLFGVFQRLHGESEFEGTGVGLAFVKRIVQRHGGRVWAEGAIDHGATFYFSLPDPPPAQARRVPENDPEPRSLLPDQSFSESIP